MAKVKTTIGELKRMAAKCYDPYIEEFEAELESSGRL